MRIGITCYPSQGGSGIVATELGLSLADRGHEIHFISYAPPLRLDEYRPSVTFHAVETPDYPVFPYPPYSTALTSKMVEVADAHELDLLHVHYAIPHTLAAWLAQQVCADNGGSGAGRRLKVITTLHGTDITLVGRNDAYFKPTRFALTRSDGVTAVSQNLADETHRVFDLPRERIEVIPNFIDRDRFAPLPPEKRKALRGCKECDFVLAHMSNFRPVKRSTDVIRAFVKLCGRVDNAKLVIIGEGPELGDCRSIATKAGVVDRVRFLGRQVAVWEILPTADVYLLTSETESFGLSALEAMSCGLPVIAGRTGGVPEVVTDGESGFLVDVGDTDAMLDAMLRLHGDAGLRRQMSNAARDRAEVFDVDRVVDHYEGYYSRVLGEA
jgi:N-acetyl-alpha-D-glucosaminyl L-malate synthase BshA